MKTLLRLLSLVCLGLSTQAAIIYPPQVGIVGSNTANVTFISTNIFNTFNATTITNSTFETTNVDIYNTLNLQSNVVVNIITNVQINLKGGSKITMYVPSSFINSNATASTMAYWDALQTLTNLANGYGFPTNNGSGGMDFTSVYPQGNGSGITNLTYKYTTNIVGAANFVFGKAYWTNATANFTFPALTMGDSAALETLQVWVTNSSGAAITATINGVAGAPGHVVPAVFYCTNAAVTRIDVSHFGVLYTNASVSAN